MHFTLDTCAVDDESPAMQRLRTFHEQGWIRLSRTDTMDTELETAKPETKRELLLARSRPYAEILGPDVHGVSRPNRFVNSSAEDLPRIEDVLRVLWAEGAGIAGSGTGAHKRRDAIHIATSIRYGATGFITRERDLLRKRLALGHAYDGFAVLDPEEALAFTEKRYRRYWVWIARSWQRKSTRSPANVEST